MRMVVVLPVPLGPRKPQIAARRDLEVDMVDHRALAEALDQPWTSMAEATGWLDCAGHALGSGEMASTLTGWPGFSGITVVGSGRASTMKTSRARGGLE